MYRNLEFETCNGKGFIKIGGDILKGDSGITWVVTTFGVCSDDNLKRLIREYVKDIVDEFINDFLRTNPIK